MYSLYFLIGVFLILLIFKLTKTPTYSWQTGLVICSGLALMLNYRCIMINLDQIRVWCKSNRDIADHQVSLLMEITSDYEIGLATRTDVLALFARVSRTIHWVTLDDNYIGWIWLRFEIVSIQKQIDAMFLKIKDIQRNIEIAKRDNQKIMDELKCKLAKLHYLASSLDEMAQFRLHYNIAVMNYNNAVRISKEFSNRNLEVYSALSSAVYHVYKAERLYKAECIRSKNVCLRLKPSSSVKYSK